MALVVFGCGDAETDVPEAEVPDDQPAATPAPMDPQPVPAPSVWKDVRYPTCPDDVPPDQCERIISLARIDYLIQDEAESWVSVPGEYLLVYEIWQLDGEPLIDGAVSVLERIIPPTLFFTGGIFSLSLEAVEQPDHPAVPCEFRVNANDTIQDANEIEPGVILCVHETGTAAFRFEYDRCSRWGGRAGENTCPDAESTDTNQP
ncbi:MAG: hypothetical protein AAGF92_01715 [Myxococcota bacterium]